MEKSPDLRKTLSQNIRSARTAMHLSQAKLAEFADISYNLLLDIEYCKTWVSDKTLKKLARALNMEAYELLIPEKKTEKGKAGRGKTALRRTAELVNAKKKDLRKTTGDIMDNLILEILKVHGD